MYKREQYSYPKEKIDDNWEKLLLNQCMSSHRHVTHASLTLYVQFTTVSPDATTSAITLLNECRASPSRFRHVSPGALRIREPLIIRRL